jgi:hypothetical protein
MTDNTITNEKTNIGRQKTQDSATQTLLKTGVERCSLKYHPLSFMNLSLNLKKGATSAAGTVYPSGVSPVMSGVSVVHLVQLHVTITNEKTNIGRQKTQDSATQTLLKTGVERCSTEWQACSPYSISSTLRVTVQLWVGLVLFIWFNYTLLVPDYDVRYDFRCSVGLSSNLIGGSHPFSNSVTSSWTIRDDISIRQTEHTQMQIFK